MNDNQNEINVSASNVYASEQYLNLSISEIQEIILNLSNVVGRAYLENFIGEYRLNELEKLTISKVRNIFSGLYDLSNDLSNLIQQICAMDSTFELAYDALVNAENGEISLESSNSIFEQIGTEEEAQNFINLLNQTILGLESEIKNLKDCRYAMYLLQEYGYIPFSYKENFLKYFPNLLPDEVFLSEEQIRSLNSHIGLFTGVDADIDENPTVYVDAINQWYNEVMGTTGLNFFDKYSVKDLIGIVSEVGVHPKNPIRVDLTDSQFEGLCNILKTTFLSNKYNCDFNDIIGQLNNQINNALDEKTSELTLVKETKYQMVQFKKEVPFREKFESDDYKNWNFDGRLQDSGIEVFISGQIPYDYMIQMYPEETKMLYYLYYNEGRDSYDAYMYAIEDKIHKAYGLKEADDFINNMSEDDILAFLQTVTEGLGDGVEGFSEGIMNCFFADGVKDASTYASMYKLQYLQEKGLLTDVYQISTSIGNMLPAMAVSFAVSLVCTPPAGSLVGSILMGMSAAGNARESAMVEGNGIWSSLFYGLAVGLSESTLGLLLGNIPGLSAVSSFTLAGLLKEGFEEGLQTYVEAGLRYVFLGETDIDMNQLSGEALKSFVYGMITSAIMNGGEIIIKGGMTFVNGQVSINNIQGLIDFYTILTNDNVKIDNINNRVVLDSSSIDSIDIAKVQTMFPNSTIMLDNGMIIQSQSTQEFLDSVDVVTYSPTISDFSQLELEWLQEMQNRIERSGGITTDMSLQELIDRYPDIFNEIYTERLNLYYKNNPNEKRVPTPLSLTEDGEMLYPPGDGFVCDSMGNPILNDATLQPGTIFDRYGSKWGRFVGLPSNDGSFASYGERSLSWTEDSNSSNYHQYRVVREISTATLSDYVNNLSVFEQFEVEKYMHINGVIPEFDKDGNFIIRVSEGSIAPAYGCKGGGTQAAFPVSIDLLLNAKPPFIVEIK